MATSLLRCELQNELDELDKRYESKKENRNKSKSKATLEKRFKKYKTASAGKLSSSSRKSVAEEKAAKAQANVDRLLKLSYSVAGTKSDSFDTIVEHVKGSKRSYEPKGRSMLKPKSGKADKKKKPAATAFTSEDFEKFANEYFVNSKPISKKTAADDGDNGC